MADSFLPGPGVSHHPHAMRTYLKENFVHPVTREHIVSDKDDIIGRRLWAGV